MSRGRFNAIRFVLAALAAVVVVAPAHGHAPGCHSHRCDIRVGRAWARAHPPACDNQHVIVCIRQAAARYRQPLADAERVATCESGLNPLAANGHGDDGLFQILYPSTWDTTPYRRRSVWSAKWNALAAMWMWSVGRRGEWACR